MPFAKDEIIETSLILDLLKLTMLVYYFQVDFIFDMNHDSTNLLKNIFIVLPVLLKILLFPLFGLIERVTPLNPASLMLSLRLSIILLQRSIIPVIIPLVLA